MNPDHLSNQVEGALIIGLGGALFEAIQFEDGKILNPRFSRYRVPRFGDAPKIEIELIDRKDLPSAAGETPIVTIARLSATRSSTPPASGCGRCAWRDGSQRVDGAGFSEVASGRLEERREDVDPIRVPTAGDGRTINTVTSFFSGSILRSVR